MLFGKKKRRISRLLIVEDEPLVAFDTEHFLRECEFEIVATVDRVADAMTVIRGDHDIDLILVDISLADGSGLDVGSLGRQAFAAALVPIVEQLAVGRVFHFVPPVAFCASVCPWPGHGCGAFAFLRGTEQALCRGGLFTASPRGRRALALKPARHWQRGTADVGSPHQIPGEWGM